MIKSIALVLSVCMLSNIASADLVNCDWKSIKTNPDHTYVYSEPLHICVGHLVYNQTLDLKTIDSLNLAIDAQADALDKADQQAQVWKAEDTILINKINEIQDQEKSKSWIWFGIGFVSASALIYGASRLK